MKLERNLTIIEVITESPITFEYDSEGALLKLKQDEYEIITVVDKLTTNNIHKIGDKDAL